MSYTTNQADSPAADAPATETKPKKTTTAKPAKRAKVSKPKRSAQKRGTKPIAERSNKKSEVVAMMKRAKGVTLSEIVEATGWKKHTVRGFVSILGSKGGEKIESSKNTAGERTYKIA